MKKIFLSIFVGVLMVGALVPVARAQVSSVADETLIGLTQNILSLVQTITGTFSQQFAAQDERITALEKRIKTLEDVKGNLGSISSPSQLSGVNTPFVGLSDADQDAITKMIRDLPDTLESACSNSLSTKNSNQGWIDRRATDRIFRLACGQIGR